MFLKIFLCIRQIVLRLGRDHIPDTIRTARVFCANIAPSHTSDLVNYRHECRRHIKNISTHPLLIMQKPTTAELRTAMQVLDKLGERLTADANHSMIEIHELQLGSHQAGQIESNAIEQTSRIKLVTAQLKTWRDELLQQRQTVSHHV
jgi:hypothetical protein